MQLDDLEYNLRQAISEVSYSLRRHRLIILTGRQEIPEEIPGETSKKLGLVPLNLNPILSEKLLDIPQSKIMPLICWILSSSPNEWRK